MANLDAPMGFRQIFSGGHEPIRRQRAADADRTTPNGDIAPGDAYTIEADGNVTRCDGNTAPNGVCEGIALKGVNEGPVSYQYLPGNVAGNVIGIEDILTEFEVQTNAVISQADLDAGAEVNVVDAAPDTVLGQSRQQVGDVGGAQFKVVAHVDRPNNDATAVNSKVIVKLLESNVQ